MTQQMTREALRALTVGRPVRKKRSATVTVDVDGNKIDVEFIEMTTAAREHIRQRATRKREPGLAHAPKTEKDAVSDVVSALDMARWSVLTIIECTVVPGTEERLFEAADEEALLREPVNGLVDKLNAELERFRANIKDVGPSSSAPTQSSDSASSSPEN